MKTKLSYQQPAINIFDLHLRSMIATSVNIDGKGDGSIGWSDEPTDEDARGKSRFGSLWD